MPIKLKGKFYKVSMRPIMLYHIECWAMKKQHIHKISVAELRMDKWKYKEGFEIRKSS